SWDQKMTSLLMSPNLNDFVPAHHSEFYTLGNLPPHADIEACIGAFYKDYGFVSILCPISRAEVADMVHEVYNSGSAHAFPANSRLCQMMLLAAVGAQLLDDSISDAVRTALFYSGKWYLDI